VLKSVKKKLLVLGAGESGQGAALLGKATGWEVFLSESGRIRQEVKDLLTQKGIEWEDGGHSPEKMREADCVVKSPGIPDEVPIIRQLIEWKKEVISEIEFAFRYKKKAKLIAITGTNGKSTTTLLTHHLLVKGGLDAGLGGNIGRSFARLLLEAEEREYYVLELSSFQLDGIRAFRPDIAILLNITPDHLDRYDYKMENYARSKFRITANQQKSDWFIYNGSDPIVAAFERANPGVARKYAIQEVEKDESRIQLEDGSHYALHNPALRGPHNHFNARCAIQVARILGIEKERIQAGLDSFVNFPHRMEQVAVVNGVSYINDSKATNVDAVYWALQAMDTPTIWIVGGQDKGNDYSQLKSLVAEKVSAIICMGIDNQPILEFFSKMGKPIRETRSAEEAVETAGKLAHQGETVLLSPACASFDLFENYEDRGNKFREAVNKLIDQ
jgi:UDP-N-acetylmuramoylalanine--D-glutamate ligase